MFRHPCEFSCIFDERFSKLTKVIVPSFFVILSYFVPVHLNVNHGGHNVGLSPKLPDKLFIIVLFRDAAVVPSVRVRRVMHTNVFLFGKVTLAFGWLLRGVRDAKNSRSSVLSERPTEEVYIKFKLYPSTDRFCPRFLVFASYCLENLRHIYRQIVAKIFLANRFTLELNNDKKQILRAEILHNLFINNQT